jgi:hypothetical protein
MSDPIQELHAELEQCDFSSFRTWLMARGESDAKLGVERRREVGYPSDPNEGAATTKDDGRPFCGDPRSRVLQLREPLNRIVLEMTIDARVGNPGSREPVATCEGVELPLAPHHRSGEDPWR